MSNGIVKWFNDQKSFGFIEQEDEPDVFFHHSGINTNSFRSLNEGNRMIFDMGTRWEGP